MEGSATCGRGGARVTMAESLECSSSSECTLNLTTDVEEVQVVSFLDRLHAPQAFDLARKHKVCRNPPPKGKCTSRGATTFEVQVVSFLDRLRAPRAFDLARKHKVCRNPPPKGKCTSRGATTFDPKGISPAQHNVRIIGRNLENNRLILEELRNRIIGRFQSILYSGLSLDSFLALEEDWLRNRHPGYTSVPWMTLIVGS